MTGPSVPHETVDLAREPLPHVREYFCLGKEETPERRAAALLSTAHLQRYLVRLWTTQQRAVPQGRMEEMEMLFIFLLLKMLNELQLCAE